MRALLFDGLTGCSGPRQLRVLNIASVCVDAERASPDDIVGALAKVVANGYSDGM
ncbi:hypothetical protein JET68_08015 [Pseudomonas monteilii]|uniref:hypothetical protein n=1 Tax=Pseudomonas TaxID=286 RepID=UPI0018E6B9DE|nr:MULTISPECIES: hypothetical protein [Pseudomonas]MBI6918741.1 hypothetical protein [Pseudomonas monteilii]MCE0937311.1 hypothetical protein [Pseudomonas kurunegalensis]